VIKQIIKDCVKNTKRDDMIGHLDIDDLATNVQKNIVHNAKFRESLFEIVRRDVDVEKIISFLSS